MWPEMYDGRCLRNDLYDNTVRGLSPEANLTRISQRISSSGSTSIKDVATLWAGTGIGLVKAVESVTDIVWRIQLQLSEMVKDVNVALKEQVGLLEERRLIERGAQFINNKS